MMKRKNTFAHNERAALLPSRQLRNEIRRRGQLDIDLRLFFELRDRPKKTIVFGNDFYEHNAHPQGEVDVAAFARVRGDRPHKRTEPRLVYGRTHSAARSKLTSVRVSALYLACAESESSFASNS